MYKNAPSPPPPVNGANTPPTSVSSSGQERKPNILFILADQIAAPLLRVHDKESRIKTPHIDALAEKSAVFTSAYCPSPLCAPSRASLVTGQLPTRINAFDNASALSVEEPTYAHYLRGNGYHTVLAGKMHFVGDQLHGYEERLTSDIYPGDFGWYPDRRLEWYHNSSSILQAGPCIRSNQLDFDEEVMYKATRYLYSAARNPESDRPFCLTVSLTHPHDPYTIHSEYWDRYEGEEIPMPQVSIPKEEQDPHSKRLQHVCDLERDDITDEAISRARRAYFGAVSYVDDNVGKLLKVLKECKMDDNTIVIFSADHGDMLGERGLWYKMSWFEGSARVPLLISYPQQWAPRTISQNVSTLDILPTLAELTGAEIDYRLPLDGNSLVPQLHGQSGVDTVYGEYMGEGTIAPLMMIKRGPWKFVTCPTDPPQLFNLEKDPKELQNLMTVRDNFEVEAIAEKFTKEASERWNMKQITDTVLRSQRKRTACWNALTQGRFESWDYQPKEDAGQQ
ncbi:uncharacterized protein KY384_006712 [Bacidia gigantensis]|uniref:uncharacterized protein n=1 Tax=Bacidia gigantensis TaxID=2732470 RepID=UPI001D04BFD4|nr:uncharacterized protein KY384_006712 [Bacidia gigantensis]KAG8529022.1 hypothetical protein KY384_006712 [Bacidia gigantensis]